MTLPALAAKSLVFFKYFVHTERGKLGIEGHTK